MTEPTNGVGNSIRRAIPCDITALAPLADDIDRFLAGHRLPRRDCCMCQVVIDEVLTNIIKYACPESAARRLAMGLRVEQDYLELSFEDDGPPFDPTSAPRPELDGDAPCRPGGLGLHVVRSLASSVHYERAGSRNRLRVRLALSAGDSRRS